MSGMVPIVVEQSGSGERAFDIYSRLLRDRIVFLGDRIDDDAANLIIAQMLFLQAEDSTKDISMYINSPGGSVTAMFAIYDTMKFVKMHVCTYCIGQAASAAAVLLSAGTKGKRFALPNARIMIHQPWGGADGSASDIRIAADEIDRLKRNINEVLHHCTGQSIDTLERDTDRDRFMSSEEALKYGLVDKVVGLPPTPQGKGHGKA